MSETHVPMWTLGDRLAKAREFAGIDRAADMAARLGVSDKTVRNWEGGVTRVTDATVIAYSSITGVPVWWLLGEDPETGHTLGTRASRCTEPSLWAA